MLKLDIHETRILELLQKNCKLSLADLANRVGLTSSPCWRRLRGLEKSGVIQRQVAILDPKSLGLGATAYIHVSLLDHTDTTIKQFLDFVEEQEQIIDCASITGDADFILKVVAEDPEHLEQFMMRRLLATGLVRGSSTNFVLRQIKSQTALPLPRR